MQTPCEKSAHADACATCNGCERCRWVATHARRFDGVEVIDPIN